VLGLEFDLELGLELEVPSTGGPPEAVVTVSNVVDDDFGVEAVADRVRQTVKPSKGGFPSVHVGSSAVNAGAVWMLRFCIGIGVDVLLSRAERFDAVCDVDVSIVPVPAWELPG